MATKLAEDELIRILNALSVRNDNPVPADVRSEHVAVSRDAQPALERSQDEPHTADRIRKISENLARRFRALGIDPREWFGLPHEDRMQALEAASRERFKAWCRAHGATSREIGERLLSDNGSSVVKEIDKATDDLMKALTRFRKLGLSRDATSKWIQLHMDVRWRHGPDDTHSELPTLVRFLERWWAGRSGLRPRARDATVRKRRSDFKTRVLALYNAVGDEWADFTVEKLALALDLLREARGSRADQPQIAESSLALMCELLGVDVTRPPAP